MHALPLVYIYIGVNKADFCGAGQIGVKYALRLDNCKRKF